MLKLGDVREVVDFPLRVDSEIDKEHKDKEDEGRVRRKEPLARPCGGPCCEGPCVTHAECKEYQEYLAHIRTTSTPIRPFREYLAQRPSANAAASGLARSGDGLDGGATS